MDRVVYYFADKTKRVEKTTEKDWLTELRNEIGSFKNVKTAEEAVARFNRECREYKYNTKVVYLRSMI